MAVGGARQLMDVVLALERLVETVDRLETENRNLLADLHAAQATITALEVEADRLADTVRVMERGE